MKPESPNPCAAFEDDLKAYLDGELPLLRRFQMRRHVTKCPRCQEELNLMQNVTEELQRSEEIAPLQADLRSKILQGVPTPPPAPQPKPKRIRRAPLEIGLAMALIALFGITTMSVLGKRISNTFNTAANSLADDDDFSDSAPPVSAGARAAAPQSTVEIIRKRDDPANARGSIDNLWKTAQRAVHNDGSLTVTVDDAESKSSAVESMVKNAGGFVASNALQTGANGLKSATLDLRIPVEKFEQIVQKIGALGTVSAKTINGQDITDRVVGAGARRQALANELAIREAQLHQKEANSRRKNTAAITDMRSDVRSLRVEAAQARAQLEALNKFSALSNLSVTLQDKAKPVAQISWTHSVSRSGHDAWGSFLNASKIPIQLLMWILAYTPFWVPALIVWRKYGRRWMEIAVSRDYDASNLNSGQAPPICPL